jgi:hypothetical protein
MGRRKGSRKGKPQGQAQGEAERMDPRAAARASRKVRRKGRPQGWTQGHLQGSHEGGIKGKLPIRHRGGLRQWGAWRNGGFEGSSQAFPWAKGRCPRASFDCPKLTVALGGDFFKHNCIFQKSVDAGHF